MKKLKTLLLVAIQLSFALFQPCYAILSETERKLQRFIVLASKSTVVSTDRCVQMLQSYLTPAATRNQVLEIAEYFKYFLYTLYPRTLTMRDYHVLYSFFRQLESFELPEQLHRSLFISLYNLPIN